MKRDREDVVVDDCKGMLRINQYPAFVDLRRKAAMLLSNVGIKDEQKADEIVNFLYKMLFIEKDRDVLYDIRNALKILRQNGINPDVKDGDLEALKAKVNSDDSNVYSKAAVALSAIPKKESANILSERLLKIPNSDFDPHYIKEAIFYLADKEEIVADEGLDVEHLRPKLNLRTYGTQDKKVREVIEKALGGILNKDAANMLYEHRGDFGARDNVERSLWDLRKRGIIPDGIRAIETLERIINDGSFDNETRRRWIAFDLGCIQTTKSANVLYKALLIEKELYPLHSIEASLAFLASKGIVPDIIEDNELKALKKKFEGEGSAVQRSKIAVTMGHIVDQRMADILYELLIEENDIDVIGTIIRRLEAFRDLGIVPKGVKEDLYIWFKLKDENWANRYIGAFALSCRLNQNFFDLLYERMLGEDKPYRSNIIRDMLWEALLSAPQALSAEERAGLEKIISLFDKLEPNLHPWGVGWVEVRAKFRSAMDASADERERVLAELEGLVDEFANPEHQTPNTELNPELMEWLSWREYVAEGKASEEITDEQEKLIDEVIEGAIEVLEDMSRQYPSKYSGVRLHKGEYHSQVHGPNFIIDFLNEKGDVDFNLEWRKETAGYYWMVGGTRGNPITNEDAYKYIKFHDIYFGSLIEEFTLYKSESAEAVKERFLEEMKPAQNRRRSERLGERALDGIDGGVELVGIENPAKELERGDVLIDSMFIESMFIERDSGPYKILVLSEKATRERRLYKFFSLPNGEVRELKADEILKDYWMLRSGEVEEQNPPQSPFRKGGSPSDREMNYAVELGEGMDVPADMVDFIIKDSVLHDDLVGYIIKGIDNGYYEPTVGMLHTGSFKAMDTDGEGKEYLISKVSSDNDEIFIIDDEASTQSIRNAKPGGFKTARDIAVDENGDIAVLDDEGVHILRRYSGTAYYWLGPGSSRIPNNLVKQLKKIQSRDIFSLDILKDKTKDSMLYLLRQNRGRDRRDSLLEVDIISEFGRRKRKLMDKINSVGIRKGDNNQIKVSDNFIFVMGDRLYCFDKKTGENLPKLENEIMRKLEEAGIAQMDISRIKVRGDTLYIYSSEDNKVYSLKISTEAGIVEKIPLTFLIEGKGEVRAAEPRTPNPELNEWLALVEGREGRELTPKQEMWIDEFVADALSFIREHGGEIEWIQFDGKSVKAKGMFFDEHERTEAAFNSFTRLYDAGLINKFAVFWNDAGDPEIEKKLKKEIVAYSMPQAADLTPEQEERIEELGKQAIEGIAENTSLGLGSWAIISNPAKELERGDVLISNELISFDFEYFVLSEKGTRKRPYKFFTLPDGEVRELKAIDIKEGYLVLRRGEGRTRDEGRPRASLAGTSNDGRATRYEVTLGEGMDVSEDMKDFAPGVETAEEKIAYISESLYRGVKTIIELGAGVVYKAIDTDGLFEYSIEEYLDGDRIRVNGGNKNKAREKEQSIRDAKPDGFKNARDISVNDSGDIAVLDDEGVHILLRIGDGYSSPRMNAIKQQIWYDLESSNRSINEIFSLDFDLDDKKHEMLFLARQSRKSGKEAFIEVDIIDNNGRRKKHLMKKINSSGIRKGEHNQIKVSDDFIFVFGDRLYCFDKSTGKSLPELEQAIAQKLQSADIDQNDISLIKARKDTLYIYFPPYREIYPLKISPNPSLKRGENKEEKTGISPNSSLGKRGDRKERVSEEVEEAI